MYQAGGSVIYGSLNARNDYGMKVSLGSILGLVNVIHAIVSEGMVFLIVGGFMMHVSCVQHRPLTLLANCHSSKLTSVPKPHRPCRPQTAVRDVDMLARKDVADSWLTTTNGDISEGSATENIVPLVEIVSRECPS